MYSHLNNDNYKVVSPYIIFSRFYREIIKRKFPYTSFSEKGKMILTKFNSVIKTPEFIEFYNIMKNDQKLFSSMFNIAYDCESEEKLKECYSEYPFLISLF